MSATNAPAVPVDERKMIPVTPDTHRRVNVLKGRLTAASGKTASMNDAVNAALDIAEAAILSTASESADA